MTTTQIETGSAREARLKRALFRGSELHLNNPQYLGAVRAILGELLRSDMGSGDLTAAALELKSERATGYVLAKEAGVAAGLDEYVWLLSGQLSMATKGGIEVTLRTKDGDQVAAGDTLAEIAGGRGDLLALERVGLNLLQRMSGIATATRNLQQRAQRRKPGTNVVGTRKTPWGLLDKRALHVGGGGTHRLNLGDAILVKNNHLALLSANEVEAAGEAVRRAWSFAQQEGRERAGFIEVEARSKGSALAAAKVFAELQARESQSDGAACPCLLLLDNLPPAEVSRIVAALREEGLLEHVLIEASGNISEENFEAYAACGADALSVGALTHSARGLDICQRIS